MKSGFTGTRMILIGIGCAAIMQAWTSYVLSHAAAWDLATATRWITGSLNTMTWERGLPVILTVIVLAPLMIACSHLLSILGLGDDLARGLGTHLTLTRVVLFVGAVVLIARLPLPPAPSRLSPLWQAPSLHGFQTRCFLVLPRGSSAHCSC